MKISMNRVPRYCAGPDQMRFEKKHVHISESGEKCQETTVLIYLVVVEREKLVSVYFRVTKKYKIHFSSQTNAH